MLLEKSRILFLGTFCILFCSGFIMSSCNGKEDKESAEDIKTHIIELEKLALNEFAKGNISGFALNFADDATYFDDIEAQHGLEGHEELKFYFDSLEGKVLEHKYELVNPKVQVYGNIAILTTRYNATKDGELLPSWKATSVYRLIGENWKVVHANWSLLKLEASDEQENQDN